MMMMMMMRCTPVEIEVPVEDTRMKKRCLVEESVYLLHHLNLEENPSEMIQRMTIEKFRDDSEDDY